MSRLFLFPEARELDPAVDSWMLGRPQALGAIAKRWFEVMRECGDDVRELLIETAYLDMKERLK